MNACASEDWPSTGNTLVCMNSTSIWYWNTFLNPSQTWDLDFLCFADIVIFLACSSPISHTGVVLSVARGLRLLLLILTLRTLHNFYEVLEKCFLVIVSSSSKNVCNIIVKTITRIDSGHGQDNYPYGQWSWSKLDLNKVFRYCLLFIEREITLEAIVVYWQYGHHCNRQPLKLLDPLETGNTHLCGWMNVNLLLKLCM